MNRTLRCPDRTDVRRKPWTRRGFGRFWSPSGLICPRTRGLFTSPLHRSPSAKAAMQVSLFCKPFLSFSSLLSFRVHADSSMRREIVARAMRALRVVFLGKKCCYRERYECLRVFVSSYCPLSALALRFLTSTFPPKPCRLPHRGSSRVQGTLQIGVPARRRFSSWPLP